MDLLNGLIDGTGNNSKDIIFVVFILALVFGFGKNTGFNLLNNSNIRSSSSNHKHRGDSCSSSGG